MAEPTQTAEPHSRLQGAAGALEQEPQGTHTALHLSYGLLQAWFNYRTLNIDNTLIFLPLKSVLFQSPWKSSWKTPAKLSCSNGKRESPIFLPKPTQGQFIHTHSCASVILCLIRSFPQLAVCPRCPAHRNGSHVCNSIKAHAFCGTDTQPL